MKRILTLLLTTLFLTILSLSFPAAAQLDTVTGHVKDAFGNAPLNGKVCFTLQNYKPNVPKVSGTGSIVSATGICVSTSSSDGSFSITVYDNTSITPSSTYYRVDFYVNGTQQSSASYIINSASFNLDTATPISISSLPASSAVGARSFLFTQTSAATTWTITHNLNDPHPNIQCFDSTGTVLYPSTLIATSANTVTATFASPQTGGCNIISAGLVNLVVSSTNAIVTTPGGPQTISGNYPLSLPFLTASGSVPTLSGTGACSTTGTQKGGSWAGQFSCTGSTGASTVTITPGTTAPNGWVCSARDQTGEVTLTQTANSSTSCTLSGTITTNDILVFLAIAY